MAGLAELRQLAAFFDLSDWNERQRSALELRRLYGDLVAEIAPDVTAEVGAYDASFSQEMKQRLPATSAVAFEANPYNFEACRGAAEAGGVEYLHLAVSDAAGTATFNVMAVRRGERLPQVKGFDSLLQRNMPDVEYEQVVVPATTLDLHFAQPRFRDSTLSLWIDVEGAAGQVLTGAANILARAASVLVEVEEVSFWEEQWLAPSVNLFLEAAGFTPIARDFEYPYQYNLLYVRPETLRLEKYDVLMSDYYSRIGTKRRA